MDQYLVWAIVVIAGLVVFPLLAVEIHQRVQQRNHNARGLRRTDKIKL